MNNNMDRRHHHVCVQRALALGRSADPNALPKSIDLLRMPSAEVRRLAASAIRPDFYLPELDVFIEYWGMDTTDYKIGMLKKQQLYQQEGKRLISIHPPDKPRLDTLLHQKLALFGYNLPPASGVGVGEQ